MKKEVFGIMFVLAVLCLGAIFVKDLAGRPAYKPTYTIVQGKHAQERTAKDGNDFEICNFDGTTAIAGRWERGGRVKLTYVAVDVEGEPPCH